MVCSEHHEPKIVTRYGRDTRLFSFERYGNAETSGAFHDRSLNNRLCRCLARGFLGRPLPLAAPSPRKGPRWRPAVRLDICESWTAGLAKAVAAGGDFLRTDLNCRYAVSSKRLFTYVLPN